MKKRILSVLLLCCMVLGLLPTTVSAADGPMDTVPKYDVNIDVYNRTSDITIKDSRSYYIYSSVPDKERDTWTWNWKIFIKGDKAAPHIFIDGVNIERSPSSKGPAIELNKKASAYLYFIGRDSTLQGATGRAAIQKNRSEGQVHVLVRTGTTVTCKGGEKAAQASAAARAEAVRNCISTPARCKPTAAAWPPASAAAIRGAAVRSIFMVAQSALKAVREALVSAVAAGQRSRT